MPPPSAPGAVTKYLHGVEGLEVVGPQEAPVRFRLVGPGVAAEPQRGLVSPESRRRPAPPRKAGSLYL